VTSSISTYNHLEDYGNEMTDNHIISVVHEFHMKKKKELNIYFDKYDTVMNYPQYGI